MTGKKELQLAYGAAGILLVVGILCYAAFSAKPPERPVRIMFTSVAGQVLFDHKTHAAESGYGLECQDCHHNLEAGETDPPACVECHAPDSDDPDVPKRSDAFHRQCIGCHQQIGAGPTDCNACHVR